MNINEMAKISSEMAEGNGFWDSYNAFIDGDNMYSEDVIEAEVAKKLMLIVSEVSEAMEARRKPIREVYGTSPKEAYLNTIAEGTNFNKHSFEGYIKNSFEDELADAVIRIGDLAHKLGIDLDWHIEQKMKYNATRPRKHGKIY